MSLPNPNFQKCCDAELKANKFSPFYQNTPTIDEKFNRKTDSNVQMELSKYTHKDAIEFAARTWDWELNCESPLPRPENMNTRVPTFQCEEESRAYYRVLGRKQASYILIACHANLHGFHRGDLRFVEVTPKTRTRGSEQYNVIGRLYLGDVVAVTQLVKRENGPLRPRDVFSVNPDDECVWHVGRMTLLSRKPEKEIHFAVLENRLAVVEGHNEEMHVKESYNFPLKMDKIYYGCAFFTDKIRVNFTEDFNQVHHNSLIALYSKMPHYSNSPGTIFYYAPDLAATRMFDVGTQAFNRDICHKNENFRDSVVEKCVLMGASAANTVASIKYDQRSLPMLDIHQEDRLVQFSIANPRTSPTEGRWSNNHRVMLNGMVVKLEATIETVVLEEDRKRIRIVVRIPRDSPKNIDFKSHRWIVQQQQSPDCPKIRHRFFIDLDRNSNGRKIIETLYGGPKIEVIASSDPNRSYKFPGDPVIRLNDCQANYVSMIVDGNPIVLGTSPFGCGKTMTIITAAREVYIQKQRYQVNRSHQLLITQSNNAGVSLIEMARKTHLDSLQIKLVRYISEKNWNVLPDASRTELDVPKLMKDVFILWATRDQPRIVESDSLTPAMKSAIVRKVTQTFHVGPEQLVGEARGIYFMSSDSEKRTEPSPRLIRAAFFNLFKPDVIVSTADSLQSLISCDGIQLNVSNIQIDEASQLPEHTLIYLLQKFPNATFGLVGDIKQLPPHCENELKGRLKKYGIGNTMERAIRREMFPQASLRYVYRCHPVTTRLLSDLFYDGTLISGVEESDRNEFMKMRLDIWPNARFPILVLNHKESGYRVGTSVANDAEKMHVVRIVKCLTQTVNHYKLKESDIGVISFYRAQSSLLTEAFRGSGVKCGTIDAFQGTEKEVMVVCCTNNKLSDFMKLGNRLNVAMSRARQATIIIGNVDGLLGVEYWNTIVQRAMRNNCYFENISQFGSNGRSAYEGPPIMLSDSNPGQSISATRNTELCQLPELHSRMQKLIIQNDQMISHANRHLKNNESEQSA